MTGIVKIGSITVAPQSVRTPRKTLKLTNLESVRILRPGLVVSGAFAVLCAGLALAFEEILYSGEYWGLLIGPWFVLPFAGQIGVLRFEYQGLGGTASLIGRYAQLRKVRAAIDTVLDQDMC